MKYGHSAALGEGNLVSDLRCALIYGQDAGDEVIVLNGFDDCLKCLYIAVDLFLLGLEVVDLVMQFGDFVPELVFA